MPTNRFRSGFFATAFSLGLAFTLFVLPDVLSEELAEQPAQPKLVVMIVFDQMRGDYLVKWAEHFDKGGFGRLLRDGASFQNCHYPYAVTLTAAGHASLSTGATPSKHGIIANDWYDRAARADVGAVSAKKYRNVPEAPGGMDKLSAPSPERLKQPTAGDGLHKKYQGKSKVVSLSIKDRSAILLAALRAAAVYWYNAARNMFVTSSYYNDTPHSWVTEFNKQGPADKYFGKDWVRLRPDLDYAKLSGPDNVALEGIGYKQDRTFPHAMKGGLDKPGKAFYDAVTNAPAGNEMLLELAKRAIDAEKLGQRDECDLLCLSFSSNDVVGHCWGPDSQEVLDITLRSDLIIKELLNYLDAKVGKDRYMVVISADHGICPIPELAKAEGKDAGRVSSNIFTTQATAFLQKTFADKQQKLPWIEKWSAGWIYLNQAALKEANVPAATVEKALADWLVKQPGIHSAYGRTALAADPPGKDPIADMVRKSYHHDCSGDVAVVVKPYYQTGSTPTDKSSPTFRTTHGSPHPYDTHVPLVVFGPGVQPGLRQERVTPQAAAAIVSKGLGMPAPVGAEYPVPDGLFR